MNASEWPTALGADGVGWSIDRAAIIRSVSLTCQPGRVTGLVGPNGSGKSSLLRLLAGLRTPDAGRVLLGERLMTDVERADLARTVAFVDQTASAHEDYTVRQVVELGRAPYVGRWQPLGPDDHDRVETALQTLELTELAQRRWRQLSGGEQQRAHIARALAQDTPVVVLDEPLNHLDIRHQLALLRTLRQLADSGRTVLLSLHDLSMALRWCDDVGVLKHGALTSWGAAATCLTPDVIADVFGVQARVERGVIVYEG